MAKRIFFAILLLLIVAASGIAALAYFGPVNLHPTNVIGEPGERTVSQLVVTVQMPVDVVSQIDLAPYADCKQGAVPLDIVVLVDTSGSMEGEPLFQAMLATQRFVDVLDLNLNQISIMSFADGVIVRTGLTSDAGILEQAAAVAAGTATGNTDIQRALQAANDELQSFRRRYNANPVVLLLSDGGGDRNATRTAAQELKDSGVQIYAIGLRGADFDENLLTDVASASETMRIAPTSDELVALFEEVAQLVSTYVLQDINYVEPIDQNRFNVNPNTISNNAQLTTNGVVWQADALRRTDVEQPIVITYEIRPLQIGYRNFMPGDAMLSLIACGEQTVTQALSRGPQLLVLPTWPYLVSIPLVLLLIPLLFWLLGKRRKGPGRGTKVQVEPQPEEPLNTGPGTEVESRFTGWLAAAQDLEPEKGRTPNASLTDTPTLILGLGASGRTVISQIFSDLSDRFGTALPTSIQLLQVEIGANGEDKATLPPMVTEVKLNRRSDRLNLDQDHLAWAEEGRRARSPRQAGRLALFADLGDGVENSALWGPFGRALADRKHLNVWIVGDGFSPESGIIADIAHLLRVRAGSGIISSIRVCLAMQHADWQTQETPTALAERSYATLRELQRLQQLGAYAFIYAPDMGQSKLRATSSGKLIDELYVLDGLGEDMNDTLYDISRLPADQGVLRALGHSLLCLLEPKLADHFYEVDQNIQTELARSGLPRLEEYASTFGCAVIQAPIQATRRLAGLRLVHHALFHPVEGLLGLGTLDKAGTTHQRLPIETGFRQRDLDDFWDKSGLDPQTAPRLEPKTLQRKVVQYLDDAMNDGRPLRLQWALQLIDQLAKKSDMALALSPIQVELVAWTNLLGNTVDDRPLSRPSRTINHGSVLDMDFNASAGPKQSFSLEKGEPLLQAWEQHWQQAVADFPQRNQDGPELPAWGGDKEAALYERLMSEPARTAERIRRRTFWLWSSKPEISLRLLILPGNLSEVTAERGRQEMVRTRVERSPQAFAYSPDALDGIVNALIEMAYPYSSTIHYESLQDYVRTRPLQQQFNFNASPLYRPVQTGDQTVSSQRSRYLAAPQNVQLDSSVVNFDRRIDGSDPAVIRLLHIQRLIRIHNMQCVADAQRAYRANADLHVFTAEQAATLREQAIRPYRNGDQNLTLSPSVVALLENQDAVLDLLGDLFVYDALHLRLVGKEWRLISNHDDLAKYADTSTADFIASFAADMTSDPTHRLRLEQWIRTMKADGTLDYTRRSQLEMQLGELADSDSSTVDLAIILAWAMDRSTTL
ncbi:VWA domain-containing protein [Candidatus Kaiserbacteria bacterium]|nr:VWA domain-containing protein [Candidatus Kaiserbacteria bacterium]